MPDLTTFAQLLAECGLEDQQAPVSHGFHHPVTLAKCETWLASGIPLAHLNKAGVAQFADRKKIEAALLKASRKRCGGDTVTINPAPAGA